MRTKIVAALAVVVLSSILAAAPAIQAAEAKWKCAKKNDTQVCSWQSCEISAFGNGDLSMSVERKQVIHLVRVMNGRITSERWINAEGGPLPDSSRPNIFQEQCVADGQLKALPPDVQAEFKGAYDIPAPNNDQ